MCLGPDSTAPPTPPEESVSARYVSLNEVSGACPPSATPVEGESSKMPEDSPPPTGSTPAVASEDDDEFQDASDGSDLEITEFPSQSSAFNSASIEDFSDESHTSLSQSILKDIPANSSKSKDPISKNS